MAADWVPIVSTVSGAVIALAGTFAAAVRTDRGQRSRDRESERLRTYVDFALALHAAHAALRAVAGGTSGGPGRHAAAGAAVGGSDLYGVRERLLMSGTTGMVRAGETVFLELIALRDVVRAGAVLSGPDYHDAYHSYAESLWSFRVAARLELGQRVITADALGHVSWSEREECDQCHRNRLGAGRSDGQAGPTDHA
ncbi:hypothetical protein ACWKSP_34470 [Micromonosporaceae bacterium Da 78-11]